MPRKDTGSLQSGGVLAGRVPTGGALTARGLLAASLLTAAVLGCGGGGETPGGAGTGGRAAGNGSGGAGGANPSGGGSGQASLPLVVTNFYSNQGWFGDAAIASFFTAGSAVIRQSESSTGPCAAGSRPPGALGKCLQVIYTPPAGLTPPTGGGAYVGVFFLTTLAMAHPELTPPAAIGDPNWGAEPGTQIPPGATKISFYAAAATAGLMVTFKAGTDADSFVLAEQPETLTTSWTPRSIPLGVINYGPSVVGGFAWVLKDTTQPATFTLDGIVWE